MRSSQAHPQRDTPRGIHPDTFTHSTWHAWQATNAGLGLSWTPLLSPFPLILQQTAQVVPGREGGLMGKHRTSQLRGSMCGPVIIYWWRPCLVGHITQRPVKSVSASNTAAAAELLRCFSSAHFVWSCGPVVLRRFSPVAQRRPFNHISDELTHYVQFLPWRPCLDFTQHLPTTRSVADEQLQLLRRFCLHFFLQRWINGLLPCCTSCHMSTWLQVQSSNVSDRGETFASLFLSPGPCYFLLLLLLPPASKL